MDKIKSKFDNLTDTEWEDAENCIMVDQDSDGRESYYTTDDEAFYEDWSSAVVHQAHRNREDLKKYKDKTKPLPELRMGNIRSNLE